MYLERYEAHRPLFLRIFLGFTVLFWGYEKLTLDKLVGAYTMDYGPFMLVDVHTFLSLVGWAQVLMAVGVFLGLFTRAAASLMVAMGTGTILIPGLIVMRDVPHFAYAFAFTGAALALLIDGGGLHSVDQWRQARRAPTLGAVPDQA